MKDRNQASDIVASPAEEISYLADAIAGDVTESQPLRFQVSSIVRLVGKRRELLPGAEVYGEAVRDSVKAYVEGYLELCRAFDLDLGLTGGLSSHESMARARARQVATGLWESTKLLPRLRQDGSVAVTADGRFEPIGDLKGQFRQLGIKDGMRARSVAILKPAEVLKDAPFRITDAEARRKLIDALPDLTLRSDRVFNNDMALRTLGRLVQAGDLVVEGFTQRLVRARLPTHSTNRRFALKGARAGADELSLETVAWCSNPNGTATRLRILDLVFDPHNDPMCEISRLSYESLERIDQELPETRKLVVFPELLALGSPRTGRDVAISRVASTRSGDFLRAAPENRRYPAALLVEVDRPPPPEWTLVFLANLDKGQPINHPSVQGQIRARHRSAELFQTPTQDGPLDTWLVSSPSNYVSQKKTEAVRDLVQKWERGPLSAIDDVRRAGHRAMFHGNVSIEVLDAMMQISLSYTMAEELNRLIPRKGE